jgi:hypothetical protein
MEERNMKEKKGEDEENVRRRRRRSQIYRPFISSQYI